MFKEKNVPIWKVEVFKPVGTTKTLLTKAQKRNFN